MKAPGAIAKSPDGHSWVNEAYVTAAGAQRFINLQPMPQMLRGGMLADLIPTFDFLNMIGGECDR